MQNLKYSTHLAEPMADLVQITVDMQCPVLLEELLKEIGALELAPEDKMGKEISKFIIRLASQNQRDLLKYLPVFSSQLDSEVCQVFPFLSQFV
jgi:hypothetical protein